MGKVILPNQTIGIIGGGQLGKMMGFAAKQMGYKIAVVDPVRGCPCSQIADYVFNCHYDDLDGLKELANKSHVITYEFENISVEAIKKIERTAYLPQGHIPLEIAQNRIKEKTVIQSLNIRVSPFYEVNSERDLYQAMKQLNGPAVLKTASYGYDGKGQMVFKNLGDCQNALHLVQQPCILEAFIGFKKELSVIVTRSTNNEIKVFPIAENVHRNHILSYTIAPAIINEHVRIQTEQIAMTLIEKLDLIGTLAIELFLLDNDELLVNEVAPRPHNSGHFTIEGCVTSQFEQHIRAICGLKLGSTSMKHPTIMVNILGQHMNDVSELLTSHEFENMKIHLYGKEEHKRNRKMGHITFIGHNQEELLDEVMTFIENKKWNGD